MADVVIVEKDKQKYALKKFHSLEKISSNPHAIVNKFLEVIEILSKIEHPNVVKVYEYGFPAGLDKPYVVMEYIEGNTLDYFVNKDLISFDQKLELIRQIAAALARIHEEGICHRDMKPANVLINMDLQAKISDFGISRLLDSGDSNTECFRGSPAYMAPECFIKDEKIDRMSDVFSLGCMAYELLTGQRPFHGNNIVEMMDKLKASSPVNPVFIDRSVSNDIQNLLGAMLQKDPVKRPEAGEVAAALKLFRKDNRDLENKQFMSEKFDIPDNHLAWKA
jgi:serine/threonine protein kinase